MTPSDSSFHRSAEDTLAIQRVVVLYGFALDARDWVRLRTVFTEDAVYEGHAAPGLDNIIEQLKVNDHPYQHILANHLVEDVTEDEVIVWSKALFPIPDERVLEGLYRDHLVRTPEGWKIKHKSVTRFSNDSPWPDCLLAGWKSAS